MYLKPYMGQGVLYLSVWKQAKQLKYQFNLAYIKGEKVSYFLVFG